MEFTVEKIIEIVAGNPDRQTRLELETDLAKVDSQASRSLNILSRRAWEALDMAIRLIDKQGARHGEQ